MTLYDTIVNRIRELEKKARREAAVTNISTSAVLTAELTIISTLLIATLMIRKINIFLMIIIFLFIGFMLPSLMPLSTNLREEQGDSFHKMSFYAILTLGVLVTLLYWGVTNV